MKSRRHRAIVKAERYKYSKETFITPSVNATFNTMGTRTGRLSVKEPNQSNVPRDNYRAVTTNTGLGRDK